MTFLSTVDDVREYIPNVVENDEIDYDKVLRKQYGDDYMTPIHYSSLHGDEVLFDTKKSYQEYLPSLRKKKQEEFKKNRIETIKKIFKFNS